MIHQSPTEKAGNSELFITVRTTDPTFPMLITMSIKHMGNGTAEQNSGKLEEIDEHKTHTGACAALI